MTLPKDKSHLTYLAQVFQTQQPQDGEVGGGVGNGGGGEVVWAFTVLPRWAEISKYKKNREKGPMRIANTQAASSVLIHEV